MYNRDTSLKTMNREKFEELVIAAIEQLPPEFQSELDNVDVLVEDWPSKAQVRTLRLGNKGQLLGLYEGIPQTKRGNVYNLVLPDKITIFQKPIEVKCRSDRQIEIEIGKVVRHEIAHHFGIGDDTLYKIESQKLKKTKLQN